MATETASRDFILARAGVAIARLQDARDMIMVAIQEVADEGGPEETPQLLDDALMCCHEAASALGLALERFKDADSAELELGEDALDAEG